MEAFVDAESEELHTELLAKPKDKCHEVKTMSENVATKWRTCCSWLASLSPYTLSEVMLKRKACCLMKTCLQTQKQMP